MPAQNKTPSVGRGGLHSSNRVKPYMPRPRTRKPTPSDERRYRRELDKVIMSRTRFAQHCIAVNRNLPMLSFVYIPMYIHVSIAIYPHNHIVMFQNPLMPI